MSDYLSPPFCNCPKCNEKSYGVLGVVPQPYTENSILARGCSNCRYREISTLPKITKKIIYLDQNIVSNLMFAANPNNSRHNKSILNKWPEILNKLLRLIKYNLITCPYSDIHILESVTAKEFHNLQYFQKILSGHIVFKHHNSIQNTQVSKYFKNYISGKPEVPPKIDESDCFDTYPHSWYMRSKSSDDLRLDFPQKNVDSELIRKANNEAHYELEKSIYPRWKKSENQNFEDLVLEEAKAFGKSKLQWFSKYYKYLKDIIECKSIEKMERPPSFDLIVELIEISRINAMEKTITIKDFFNSKKIMNVPSVRISSEYFASIARKLKEGMANKHPQKNNPSPGMSNDSISLSTFLPYCDAFFTDNENYALFHREPLKSETKQYNTEIFSIGYIDEFIKYLDNIWSRASKSHLSLVESIYDEEWLQSDEIDFS